MQGQAPEKRRCCYCGSPLSSYNPGPLCFPCDKTGRWVELADETKEVAPSPCGERIVDLAKELLREQQRWGLIGVEYIFFHQFFNGPLQLELKQMRRQLYGQEDPPMPMTLREAEQAFRGYAEPTLGEMQEQADGKAAEVQALSAEMEELTAQLLAVKDSMNRKKLASLVDELLALGKEIEALQRDTEKLSLRSSSFEIGKDRLLGLAEELRSKGLFDGVSKVDLRTTLKILALPLAEGEGSDRARVFWQVAERLGQLERELPTYPASLHMALVCGTPPVPPPNISFEWTIDLGQPMVFRIYSAKVRDVSGLYQAVIEDLFGLRTRKHRPTEAPDIEAKWIEEGPLPYLKISLFPRPGFVHTSSHVQRVLRKEAAGQPFYDRGTKVFDIAKRIRTWATASLKVVCRMGNRDALQFWDAHCTDDRLRYRFGRDTITDSSEVQLQQEINHVRQRLASIDPSLNP